MSQVLIMVKFGIEPAHDSTACGSASLDIETTIQDHAVAKDVFFITTYYSNFS